MKLSKGIEGFLLFKSGAGLTRRTLETYKKHLCLLAQFLENPEIEQITATDLLRFLDYLKNSYQPRRWDSSKSGLKPQSIRNAWTAVRSFYTWVGVTLDLPDVMRGKVPRPRAQNTERAPFSKDEVQAILKQVKPARAKRPKSGGRYIQALRDQAIILLLLDTGIRASELCNLTIGDVHLKSGRINIMGKGAKQRYVQIGDVVKARLWQYLSARPDGSDPTRPLFTGSNTRGIERTWLRKNLAQIGKRAGVEDVYPHRFRYTFAIEYLRNGGDILTLQKLLGHNSLEMVQRYAKIAGADTERVHRIASPADNWLK